MSKENLRVALRALASYKLRSVLTTLGIIGKVEVATRALVGKAEVADVAVLDINERKVAATIVLNWLMSRNCRLRQP